MRDWVILPKFKNLFIKGKAKNHLFGSKDLSFSVVALRLNFKQPRGQLFSGFCTADGGSCSECNNCQGLWNPQKSFDTSVFFNASFVSEFKVFDHSNAWKPFLYLMACFLPAVFDGSSSSCARKATCN